MSNDILPEEIGKILIIKEELKEKIWQKRLKKKSSSDAKLAEEIIVSFVEEFQIKPPPFFK